MSTLTVKLSRGDNTPWGFRIQGGKDFGSPVSIQRVNPKSLAEQNGLQPGDMILTINNSNADLLRHKEAQDTIIRAGNSLELKIERGGTRIWKPTVTPVGDLSQPGSLPLTKTSLAANKQDFRPVGSGHNVPAKPFSNVPSIVNKQYNSPVNLYSMQNIAECLTAHTEVLATGVKGINFMKEDKPINKGSAVYQMVHQGDEVKHKGDTDEDDPLSGSGVNTQSNAFRRLTVGLDTEPVPPPGMIKHVTAPTPKPPTSLKQPAESNQSLCADCGRLIVGVFVRVKDKSLHAECFKCSTCGSSLKNVGYYTVNEKLYCDVHAKQAAMMIGAPANLEPVTVPPGGSLPYNTPIVGVGPTPPAAAPAPAPAPAPVPLPMAGPKSPGAAPPFSNISPMPFHRADVLESLNQEPLTTNGFHDLTEAPKAPVAPPTAPHVPGGFGGHPKTAPPGDAHRELFTPRRGRGQLKTQATPGTRIPICADCGSPIRGPFIVALGKTWCPDHFLCKNSQCKRPLQDIGFVEEQGQLYCEVCWEAYLAPICCKCNNRIKGDCLNALDRQWHPECFVCAFCRQPFGTGSFYLEDGQPYCEKDWNEMFTTKCVGCGFPIEAGDRWVEALNNNYHSQCFKCTICHKNLEGQSFFAKGGRPFCKAHAR